ncbi:phosphoglycerate mutase-like protein [Lentinus tigrinus ALCF2SS1-7]|uniref:Phosphoglycerate mutase-like protein n=1 Tax=Lentinus tigrinus ALCF2SS1-6 TaxID=1328759 RepID=A0A5C2SGQ1_9APHY|nr:phosphoglycerate mutase-like protein [Lentinus tigrinus ALCF2SS1-6]RPD82596.1 phosphoglycerate mutase-like protein [Lentinus tigrinus ALCF2SS1-7]
MTIENIYIARHGYRQNWVTDDWKSVTGLPRDPTLADFGVLQAKELASYFLSLPEEQRPTAIFSSPYYRCLETAKPSAEAMELPLYVEHGLSEWYSPAAPGTGLHPRPASASALSTHFPAIDDSWQSIYYPSRKGEDISAVHDRTREFMRALVPAVEERFEGKHKRILLVTHAATVIGLTRELIGDRNLPLRVGCCTLTDLQRPQNVRDAVGCWQPKKLADGGHLKDGVTREWGFENCIIVDGKVIDHHGEPGSENEVDHPVGLQVHLLPVAVQTRM